MSEREPIGLREFVLSSAEPTSPPTPEMLAAFTKDWPPGREMREGVVQARRADGSWALCR